MLELRPIPPADVATLSVTTAGGLQSQATVTRNDGRAFARFDDTTEPGLHQLGLPRPPGGSAFATVAADARESDLRFLAPAEKAALARDWPLSFEAEPDRLAGRLFASGRGGRHEIWRYLRPGHPRRALCRDLADSKARQEPRDRRPRQLGQESRPMSFDLVRDDI